MDDDLARCDAAEVAALSEHDDDDDEAGAAEEEEEGSEEEDDDEGTPYGLRRSQRDEMSTLV
jgi:hypothetical protein